MRLLLLSAYELGHQPLGIAGPAPLLAAAGHEVRGRDLAVEALQPGDLDWAEGVVWSVPMHTALRLALAALAPVRASHPHLRVALHGLYAPAGADALRAGDLAVAGTADEALLAWAASPATGPPATGPPATGPPATGPLATASPATGPLATGPTVRVELGRATTSRSAPLPPDRSTTPPLDRYARLVGAGPERLVGAVETTRGCSHRCRHCPVPTVYDGRTRAVDVETVLADVAQLVEAGAGHVDFADPDFLNRPAHALRVVRALHARWPELTFDATIKVSHVLAHRDVIAELGASGCLFVVSAFESTSQVVLDHLAKGHTPADEAEAVAVLRAAGIEPRPSFLPFTPWTELGDVVELLDFVAAHDLAGSVDPVQYGIRLLLPPGSLLLAEPDPVLAASLGEYEPGALGWTWSAPDPAVDTLQSAIAARTEEAAACDEDATATYAAVRALAFAALGSRDPGRPPVVAPAASGARPRLTEAWFCCAEPTSLQLGMVGTGIAVGSSAAGSA